MALLARKCHRGAVPSSRILASHAVEAQFRNRPPGLRLGRADRARRRAGAQAGHRVRRAGSVQPQRQRASATRHGKISSEAGTPIETVEPQTDAQREEALRRFASQGFWPIVAVGAGQAGAVDKVAKQFPNVRFTLVDAIVDLANVQSLVFKEHEGSFLVGVLAGKASRTGKVGFIGGRDTPLTRRYACGFAQGVRYANAKVELLLNMAGVTQEASNDPIKGIEIARGQIDRGADVIFQVGRGTGIAALRATADAGRLAIGSDANQNWLYPGSVLTSMVKRFDTATEAALKSAVDQSWRSGVVGLGVKERGVSFALDDHNRALITAEMKALVDQATRDVVSGLVRVQDFLADQHCPI